MPIRNANGTFEVVSEKDPRARDTNERCSNPLCRELGLHALLAWELSLRVTWLLQGSVREDAVALGEIFRPTGDPELQS